MKVDDADPMSFAMSILRNELSPVRPRKKPPRELRSTSARSSRAPKQLIYQWNNRQSSSSWSISAPPRDAASRCRPPCFLLPV